MKLRQILALLRKNPYGIGRKEDSDFLARSWAVNEIEWHLDSMQVADANR